MSSGGGAERSSVLPVLQEFTAQKGRWAKAQEPIQVKGKSKRCREVRQGEGGWAGTPGWGLIDLQGDPDAGSRRTKGTSPAHVCKQCASGKGKAAEPRRQRGFGQRGAKRELETALEGGGQGQTPAWKDVLAVCAMGYIRLPWTISWFLYQNPGSAQLGASASRSAQEAAASIQARLGQGLSPRAYTAIGRIHLGKEWVQRDIPERSVLWSGLVQGREADDEHDNWSLYLLCARMLPVLTALGHLLRRHQVPGALPKTLAWLHLARVAEVGVGTGGGVVFSFCSCCNKVPQIGWLKAKETYSPSVLKAKSPTSGVGSSALSLQALRRGSFLRLPTSGGASHS